MPSKSVRRIARSISRLTYAETKELSEVMLDVAIHNLFDSESLFDWTNIIQCGAEQILEDE